MITQIQSLLGLELVPELVSTSTTSDTSGEYRRVFKGANVRAVCFQRLDRYNLMYRALTQAK